MSRRLLSLLVGLALAVSACGASRKVPPASKPPDAGTKVPEVPKTPQNPKDAGSGSGTGKDGGTSGETDGGVTDGGTDGGVTDGGMVFDGGVVTIGQARELPKCSGPVTIQGAMVASVIDSDGGTSNTYFWIKDPNNPQGIYVRKHFSDTPGSYTPRVGDLIDLVGYTDRLPAWFDRNGYRQVFSNPFYCGDSATKLTITHKGSLTPPGDAAAPPGFGNADGGSVKANPSYAGSRVFIAGPLTVTNARPPAFKRSDRPEDEVYLGFELSGGILVNNYRTYSAVAPDGGTCDYRKLAAEGRTVTFPDGIRGVWDSFTNAPCFRTADGGCSNLNDAGYVPGTSADFTYVLYPQDCAVDLAGAVVE